MKEKGIVRRIKNMWSLQIIIIFIIVSLSYVIYNGENIYITIHDNLDSNLVWYRILANKKFFFDNKAELPILGGVSRGYFMSYFKVYLWLYRVFPTFVAYVIGWYIKIIISVVGFCWLSSVIYNGKSYDKNIVLMCGFLYGIIPTYPTSAFSFASLPCLLTLMLLLYKGVSFKSLIAILIYPVFSDLSTMGFFLCGYVLLFFFIDWGVKKRPLYRMLAGFLALSSGYICSEYGLIHTMLFSEQVSMRNDSSFVENYNTLGQAIKEIVGVLIKGQYHAGDLHAYVVLPVCLIGIIVININYIKKQSSNLILKDELNWIFLLIIANSIVYGLDSLEGFKNLIGKIFPFLHGFSFTRTLWINPFLWYLLFMCVVLRANINQVWKKIILLLALIVTCIAPEVYNQVYLNLKPIVYEVLGKEYDPFTYREFYSEELFSEIKKQIGYNGEWSVAFGMHPAVIEYNGIASLDGYLSYYSMDYKRQFRKLISPDLEIDDVNRVYFDDWGGRAYVFSKDVSYEPLRAHYPKEGNLYIDENIFTQMKGKYIFSRVNILNINEYNFEQIGVFSNNTSPYIIYVYKNLGF